MNYPIHLTAEAPKPKEDISNAVADEHSVLYSRDGKRLLKCENKNLTDYTVRNGTEVICDYAFSGCTGLTSTAIPESVTKIGESAFEYCTGLTSVTIPESVTVIGGNAFFYCTGLTEVIIPESVTTIGNSAFSHCMSLTSVTIPNSVTEIGRQAFYKCTSLASVTIPNNVTSICSYAFCSCTGLTSVTIPNSVTSICSYAFEWCTGLKQVTIGNSVTEICMSAFSHCMSLTSVTIPNSVTAIDSSAFAWCTGLKKLEVVGDNKDYCSVGGVLYSKDMTTLVLFPLSSPLLPSFDIPESVTSIGERAFYHCKGLTRVTIPNSVTEIGKWAFGSCTGLTSVAIPESVTSIDSFVFQYCTGLTSVAIPESVTSIDGYAFDGCSGLTSVTIPNSVTEIGYYAFQDCMGLKSIAIPNSVVEIGECAFAGCTRLTKVTIGNSVTKIGENAFFYCTKLTNVTIHNSATNIGQKAFAACFRLNVIRIICSQNEESFVLAKFKKLLPDELHDIISIEYGEQLPFNKINKVTHAEPTECETLATSETDDLYANDIADKLGVNRVDYDIPSETRDEIDWEYPVVKYPELGCVVFPYRNRSIARMGYMEPLFLDYLHETFEGCGLQIVGDCSILPRNGQRPYEPDIAIISDEYPSLRIDVEIDEPYAAVTNKPIHYIGCGDDFRDMNLNNLGWIVIRFTEYQVYSDMKGCAAFIAQVLHDIQPRMSLPAYLLSYPGPETVERWQEIEAKVLATEKYREKYLKHKFTESEERKYTTADVTQTELEKECAELVSPLIASPTSETTDEAIERGDISTHQEHTDESRQTQHDTAAIDTNPTDEVSAPSTVLPVSIEKRDEHIQFFPFEHIYLYNGCAQLTPVSSVIDCFFGQFDAVTQAQVMASKDKPAGKILEDWDIKGCMAKEAGTFMHKQIENTYNGLEYQKVYHFRYDGKYLHADKEIPLEREYQHFQNFLKDHDFKPDKTEWAIYDENLEIAGTIDMLHKRGDVFDIYDWKRSNKIIDEQGTPVTIGFRGKSGINGLECVQDTAYWHYCIQQNLYRYILEKNYGITVGKMYLVIMIATMDNYIKLEVPRMEKAIDVIVEKCRNGFIKWMNIGLPF